MKNRFLDIFRKTNPKVMVNPSKGGNASSPGFSGCVGNSSPVRNQARADASGQSNRTAASLLDRQLIDEAVRDWMYDVTSEGVTLDRVLNQAMTDGLITVDDVVVWSNMDSITESWSKTASTGCSLSWRQVLKVEPWRSLQLQRVAARVYGFRSVLICQMSTLVLADMMAPTVPPAIWDQMFEMELAPVVQHGQTPKSNGRILCVSKDPSNRITRNYVNGLTQFSAELAYADAPIVRGMLELIAQHVPAIGASVYTSRPTLQKVPTRALPSKKAA